MNDCEVDEKSSSVFEVNTPVGPFKIDMEDFEAAKTR